MSTSHGTPQAPGKGDKRLWGPRLMRNGAAPATIPIPVAVERIQPEVPTQTPALNTTSNRPILTPLIIPVSRQPAPPAPVPRLQQPLQRQERPPSPPKAGYAFSLAWKGTRNELDPEMVRIGNTFRSMLNFEVEEHRMEQRGTSTEGVAAIVESCLRDKTKNKFLPFVFYYHGSATFCGSDSHGSPLDLILHATGQGQENGIDYTQIHNLLTDKTVWPVKIIAILCNSENSLGNPWPFPMQRGGKFMDDRERHLVGTTCWLGAIHEC
ncbi:hypothetical protein B0T26DRAFT_310597 [Lasiosphaeria miniovina]|uniref:Uncharacterized protein n=1 Tax=Lasiosphaeria miniovina TaxID=1954250 RepID=A0AA40ALF3_9PEZI|nr:uncharacterized protein B0T26DRAFT_310597 [Lasiosphaeria miniovina]KAK0718021.1 hypothetical protein B0T26DRAFT_310597 [Lasiosphaeria miniovina]